MIRCCRALALLPLLLLLPSCSTPKVSTAPKALTKSDGNAVPLKWTFESAGRDGIGVPQTDVYLTVGSERHLIQKKASGGDFEVFGPAAWNGLPKSALTACYARWAGTGDAFYVVQKSPGTALVYKGYFEEVYGFGGFKLLREIAY